jgi:hypothetical protein
LTGLTITGGHTDSAYGGGGLLVDVGSAAMLEWCSVHGNVVSTASGFAVGGGVANRGELTARRVHITSNEARAAAGQANGGGLDSRGGGTAVVVEDGTVHNNTAVSEGADLAAGGGISITLGNLMVRRVHITFNEANGLGANGGGLRNFAGTAVVEDGTVHNNTAVSEGGGGVFGGGIVNGGGVLTLRRVHVMSNEARAAAAEVWGGGLFTSGPTLLFGARLSGSSAMGAVPRGQQLFVTAETLYVLPAPLGRWLFGVVECLRVDCPAHIPCPDQPCNLDTHPSLENKAAATVPIGAFDGDEFPPLCAVGSYASGNLTADQDSAICSGLCPAGRACFEPGSAEPLDLVEPGSFTHQGDRTPRRCSVGFYSEAGASECTPCQDDSTTRDRGSPSPDSCICNPSFMTKAGTSGATLSCDSCPVNFDCGNAGTTLQSA